MKKNTTSDKQTKSLIDSQLVYKKPENSQENGIIVTKDAAKQAMIHFRSLGFDEDDCCLLAGYTGRTLYNWKKADPEFALDMARAWAMYKGRLISKVEDKDPKYLLQNDFSDRFKKDKEVEPPQTQNNLFIGYDKLAERLAGLLSGSVAGSDQTTTTE